MSLILYALLASSAPAATEARDWGAALRMDATALHDDIAANHPGPVNPTDPGFEARNDAQLALALRRAKTAKSYADYFYAMRHYVASFNDGHVSFGVFGATPEDYRWPGFLTRYDSDGKQRVFSRADWAPVPVGAELVGCDGKPANEVSAEVVGSIMGRWKLLSQRLTWGNIIFTNETDPYITHPCAARSKFTARDVRSLSTGGRSTVPTCFRDWPRPGRRRRRPPRCTAWPTESAG